MHSRRSIIAGLIAAPLALKLAPPRSRAPVQELAPREREPGDNGEVYLDMKTGAMYQRLHGQWILMGNLL